MRNTFLGESVIHAEPVFINSIAYFCSSCGDIWGRAHVEGANLCEIADVVCEKHKPTSPANWRATPGSFLDPLLSTNYIGLGGWAKTIEVLPNEMLKREFLLSFKESKHESQA